MKFLIVIDMQNDFVSGPLSTPEASETIPNVVAKINGFDGAIAITKDTHPDNYLELQEGKHLPIPHCIDSTDGCELHSAVFTALNDKYNAGTPVEVFAKPTFGSVALAEWLVERDLASPIDEIVLVGLCTDICVISNALLIKAFLPEVTITVDASCCAGVTPESHRNALSVMRTCQINIVGKP